MRRIGCAVVASLMVLAGCSKKNGGSREPSEMPMPAEPQETSADAMGTEGEAPSEGSSTAPGTTGDPGEPGEPGQRQLGATNPTGEPGAPEGRLGEPVPGQPGATTPGQPGTQPGRAGVQGRPGAGTPTVPPGATAAMTPDQVVQRFDALIAAFNTKDVNALAGAYASDAITVVIDSSTQVKGNRELVEQLFQPQVWAAFPDLRLARQLTFVEGATVIAIVHATGTNTGPVMTAGPTNKKLGMYGVVHINLASDGKVKAQAIAFDPITALGQLGLVRAPVRPADSEGWPENQRATLMPTGSETEAANLLAITKLDAAFAIGNIAAVMESVAEDIVYHDMGMAKDFAGTKAVRKVLTDFSKGFTGITVGKAVYLAAGDWVFSRADYTMLNSGDNPSMKLKKTGKTVKLTDYAFYRFENGKIKHAYLFHNGLAMAAQLGMVASAEGAMDKKAVKQP